jgi:hypothetical protein
VSRKRKAGSGRNDAGRQDDRSSPDHSESDRTVGYANAALMERIDRLERELAVTNAFMPRVSSRTPASTQSSAQTRRLSPAPIAGGLTHMPTPSSHVYGKIPNGIPNAENLQLPPREEVLPVVDRYFRGFGRVVPLFDKAIIVDLINSWYDRPRIRTSDAWAAVQVVLALGLRMSWANGLNVDARSSRAADAYLQNALGIIPDVMFRPPSLLAIQILLGIAMLLQNKSDQRPTSNVVAIIVSLVHQVGLQSPTSGKGRTTAEEVQRRRVFWIAYTFDKVWSRVACVKIKTYLTRRFPFESKCRPCSLILTRICHFQSLERMMRSA